MRRTVASVAVIAFFSLLLVGTSKPKEDPTPPPPTVSATASAAPTAPHTTATIPPTTGWTDQKIAKAKVKLKLPKGATALADQSGSDPSVGSYVRVRMPSGYTVYASQSKPGAVATTKGFYAGSARGEIDTIYDAADAIVANRKESGPAGSYCEVTTCSRPVGGKPFCVQSAGAEVDGTKVTKLTADECLQVVAMVRSIEGA